VTHRGTGKAYVAMPISPHIFPGDGSCGSTFSHLAHLGRITMELV